MERFSVRDAEHADCMGWRSANCGRLASTNARQIADVRWVGYSVPTSADFAYADLSTLHPWLTPSFQGQTLADENNFVAVVVAIEDETAIRSLLARLHDAWARGDGAAYAQCFAEQSDYITFNGMHLRSRAENSAVHSALFRGVLKDTGLSVEIESIVLLSSNIALVHTAGSGRKRSYQTYVLVKAGGDWLIRSFQNTRVQPLSVKITRWAQRCADRR
ncbi:SgcJ/EcaC family oxidoreductase [Paraburkholderia sp. BR13439]|uniref:SgcJ/EcaC family oxidoreductase n=1 Tax=Paraburkholderia sp. BR13439 TaxID=3236996 RepID=UPI0034D007A6